MADAEGAVFCGIGAKLVKDQAEHDDGLAADWDTRTMSRETGCADNGKRFEGLKDDAL
jgi:hypothetical protein